MIKKCYQILFVIEWNHSSTSLIISLDHANQYHILRVNNILDIPGKIICLWNYKYILTII